MLIKCPECNHDNQLGAIFCRNCGAKLDVETIRPKVIDHRGSDIDFFGLARRIISLLVLIGLIGVIYMMFSPSPDFVQTIGEDQVETAKVKFDELIRRLDGGFGRDTHTFSAAEATFLYNDKFLAAPTAEGGSAYNIERLSFHLDAQNYSHFRLKTKLGNKIPVTFEIKGFIPEPTEDEPGVRFTVTRAKMGKMQMPAMAHKNILEKFLPTLDGGDIQRILAGAGRIEAQDGQYVITLKQ